MSPLLWVLGFILYFFGEFTVNIFFSYKIKHIGDRAYIKAGLMGAVSTFLFLTMTVILAGTLEDGKKTFILLMIIATSLGNFCATAFIPVIEKFIKKEA